MKGPTPRWNGIPPALLPDCGSWRKGNDGIEKTCQHGAMKHPKHGSHRHPKQGKHPRLGRSPIVSAPAHPSALTVPAYHRILVKHGLIEKTLSIHDAYEVFLKVGADPEVQKLRSKVEHGSRMKHVPALYLATAMALQGMTKQELEALKLRIEDEAAIPSKPGLPSNTR